MGLRLTTKVTVSGWRFLLRRVEHAIVRRDTRMFDDPLQYYSRSVAVGIVVSILVLLGAVLLAYFKPQGKLGNSNLVADRATSQIYIILSGRLHPVYNLTSARLVLGSPSTPTPVNPNDLSSLPRGQYIGIPGAPFATPVSSNPNSDWTLCDTVAAADSVGPAVETAVIATPLVTDPSIGPIPANQALLASFQGRDWIITQKGRYSINRADRALSSAVGITVTSKPTQISVGMFNALPNIGAWQLPPVPNSGAPNTLGLAPELVVGAVFQTNTNSTSQNYLVLTDGIAPVNATTASALRATDSFGLVTPPQVAPNVVVSIPERDYASPLPDEPLKILSRQEAPTLCWTWQRTPGDQAPKTNVIVGRHLPIAAAAMNTGIQQIQGDITVFMGGGRFVRLQSPDPRYGESLYYIDPQGVRFGLPTEQTAGSLGLSGPKYAPWEIVRLLVDGPVLSQENALLEHDTLPADPSPRSVAPPGAPPGVEQTGEN